MASPSDTTYAIIRETVEGTTPATPAMINLDYIPGNEFVLDAKMVTSDTLKSSRAMAGARKLAFSTSGTIKQHFRRDTATDLLLESALSGAFASNVLKAGKTDSSHTIQKTMIESGSPLISRFVGMQVQKFGLTVDSESNCEATFDMLGMDRINAVVSGTTYTAPTQGQLLNGLDVGLITIAGVTGVFTSLELSVDHNREARSALGSKAAIGIGTSGVRTVKLTVKLYRKDFNPETVFIGDTPVAVSFQLGTAANGYKFDITKAVGSVPKDEVNASKALVSIEMWAQEDTSTGTDLTITRLT